jgi:hypothetical protein
MSAPFGQTIVPSSSPTDTAGRAAVAAKRLEHGCPQLVFEVDLAHAPVVEGEAENEALKRLDRVDSRLLIRGTRIISRPRLTAPPVSLPLSQLQRGSPEVYAVVISSCRESLPVPRVWRSE